MAVEHNFTIGDERIFKPAERAIMEGINEKIEKRKQLKLGQKRLTEIKE